MHKAGIGDALPPPLFAVFADGTPPDVVESVRGVLNVGGAVDCVPELVKTLARQEDGKVDARLREEALYYVRANLKTQLWACANQAAQILGLCLETLHFAGQFRRRLFPHAATVASVFSGFFLDALIFFFLAPSAAFRMGCGLVGARGSTCHRC